MEFPAVLTNYAKTLPPGISLHFRVKGGEVVFWIEAHDADKVVYRSVDPLIKPGDSAEYVDVALNHLIQHAQELAKAHTGRL